MKESNPVGINIKEKYDGYFLDSNRAIFDSIDTKMLPYCNIYINEKFIRFLIEKKGKNTEEIYNNAISQIELQEKLIMGIFIGGGKRGTIPVPDSERIFSDYPRELETFKPDFYFHSLSNCTNQLYFNTFLPVLIKRKNNYNSDTLMISLIEPWDTLERSVSFLKLKDSILINNKYRNIWKITGLNNNNFINWKLMSERFIEMNYLKDAINIPSYEINHSYFRQLLEYAIEDILGKTEFHYLDDDGIKHPEKYISKFPDEN